MRLDMTNRDATRTVLNIMLDGWVIYLNSFNHEQLRYTVTEEEAMLQACQGDEVLAHTVSLMTHWSNDLQVMATHMGLALVREAREGQGGLYSVKTDIPPAPDPLAHWTGQEWIIPPELETVKAEA